MLNGHKIFCDKQYHLGWLYAGQLDNTIDDFSLHEIQPNSIYILGPDSFKHNLNKIKDNVDNAYFILNNTVEGSQTLIRQCGPLGVTDLLANRKMSVISSGEIGESWHHLLYEKFLLMIKHSNNNDVFTHINGIYDKKEKPYKFLFLNGRHRPHRHQLLNRLQSVLHEGLWTNLSKKTGPLHFLPKQYEVEKYQNVSFDMSKDYVKRDMFNGEWGEGVLTPAPYVDTYFSIISETVFDYPYSFRTEKIWKPIVMGHPWIAVANCGFYNDLRNMGFKTFNGIIDESFDKIKNNSDRLKYVSDVIKDLCTQDLQKFLKHTEDICRFNQEHFKNVSDEIIKEFPAKFQRFINECINK